jgi:replication-associated recombination protein RarA
MPRQQFYQPTDRGREGAIKERLERFAKLRKERG